MCVCRNGSVISFGRIVALLKCSISARKCHLLQRVRLSVAPKRAASSSVIVYSVLCRIVKQKKWSTNVPTITIGANGGAQWLRHRRKTPKRVTEAKIMKSKTAMAQRQLMQTRFARVLQASWAPPPDQIVQRSAKTNRARTRA